MDIYFNRNQEEVLLHYIQDGYLIDQGAEGRDRIFSGREELTKVVLESSPKVRRSYHLYGFQSNPDFADLEC